MFLSNEHLLKTEINLYIVFNIINYYLTDTVPGFT